MNIKPITILLISLLTTALDAKALSNVDKEFVNAAVQIMLFDYFAKQCNQNSGFTTSETAKIDSWRTNNSVDKIRSRLDEFEKTESNKKLTDNARASIKDKLAGSNQNPCESALLAINSPQAQFSQTSPNLLASLVNKPASNKKLTTTDTMVTAKPNAKNPKALNELLSQIDSFGFNSRPKMGIGGFIMLDIYPIVLFKNGDLLDNIEGLNFNGSMVDYKKAKPEDWSSWRRNLGKLQIKGDKGWGNLEFQDTYSKLPNGFKLNGFFRSLSGAGNLAIGGNQSVTAWDEYLFSSDGRVVKGGGAGSTASTGDFSVATSSAAANQRGKYHINGLILQINFDDGSSENRIIVTDPKDPKSVIWLDGTSYVRRDKK